MQQQEPTYTADEILHLIEDANEAEMKAIGWLVGNEIKLYPLDEMKRVFAVYTEQWRKIQQTK